MKTISHSDHCGAYASGESKPCSCCGDKLIGGSVNLEAQVVCDEHQIASGFMLTCVAIPTSNGTIETHAEDSLY